MVIFVASIAMTVLNMAIPLLIQQLILVIETDGELWIGLASIAGIVGCVIGSSIVQQHAWYRTSTKAVHTWIALTSLIYAKPAALTRGSLSAFSEGELINLMTVDCQAFLEVGQVSAAAAARLGERDVCPTAGGAQLAACKREREGEREGEGGRLNKPRATDRPLPTLIALRRHGPRRLRPLCPARVPLAPPHRACTPVRTKPLREPLRKPLQFLFFFAAMPWQALFSAIILFYILGWVFVIGLAILLINVVVVERLGDKIKKAQVSVCCW
jgi:ABC-type multidrug transport system fused ATPase/permease subunit